MKRFFLKAASICALGAGARADIIDFSEAGYAFVSGKPATTITAAGCQLTLIAELGPGIPAWALPHLAPNLSHETGSGLGVNTAVANLLNIFDPEIEWFERLSITSSPSFALLGFTVSNLYKEGWIFPHQEQALYRVNGGAWEPVNGNTAGSVYVSLGDSPAAVFSLEFKAARAQGLFQQNDFTVASLHVAPVPEPGTFALLGGVLLLVGVFHRRLRSARLQ